MTRLSSAFGEKYQSNALRTKSFELGGHTFKVRIPLTKEMEVIQQKPLPCCFLLQHHRLSSLRQ